jgi:endonuclease/exonuclease/phosphatase family metal-dependent hydrolase
MNKTVKKTVKNKNKLKQVGGNDSINVLCWNICWQAMKGVATGSAPILGASCSRTEIDPITGLNVCSTNVIKVIDSLSIDYDFVAIQEAEKWKTIHNHSNKLRAMGYVHHRIGSSDLVTFYNKKKYEALAVVTYTIIINGNRGRPYHIIYLKNKINSEFYIFINLHNADDVSKDDLERQLASKFNNFFAIEKTEQEGAQHLKTRIEIPWNLNKYNVIVAGDFNDRGLKNYWQGLYPFKHTNIPILKDILVKCNAEPPKTCCREIVNTNPPDNGDYILVNSSLTIEKNNYIPQSEDLFPSSDHLPVLIELKTRSAVIQTRRQSIINYEIIEPPPEQIPAQVPTQAQIPTIIPTQAQIPTIIPTQAQAIIPAQAQIPEIIPAQAQIPEIIPAQAQEAETRPPTQVVEIIPAQAQEAETRPPTQVVETRPPTQVVEIIPAQAQETETRPPTQVVEARLAQAQETEIRPPTQVVETRPQPTQGAEARPPTQVVEARPIQEVVQEPIEKREITRERETEPDPEPGSSNMFSAPLMAMICAIPVIFLLSK